MTNNNLNDDNRTKRTGLAQKASEQGSKPDQNDNNPRSPDVGPPPPPANPVSGDISDCSEVQDQFLSTTSPSSEADIDTNQVCCLHLERIEKQENQIAELTDRLLRANAELQNLHKRLERERAETAKYAISKFAVDAVSVADNFERAISSIPEGSTDESPLLKGLLDGVTMTEREFLNVLKKHGINQIDPKGKPFDPHFHQAVLEQEDFSVPSGTVVQVYQTGYTIGERSLRPAMVAVSKGGIKLPKKSNQPSASISDSASTQPEQVSSTDNASASADEESNQVHNHGDNLAQSSSQNGSTVSPSKPNRTQSSGPSSEQTS